MYKTINELHREVIIVKLFALVIPVSQRFVHYVAMEVTSACSLLSYLVCSSLMPFSLFLLFVPSAWAYHCFSSTLSLLHMLNHSFALSVPNLLNQHQHEQIYPASQGLILYATLPPGHIKSHAKTV